LNNYELGDVFGTRRIIGIDLTDRSRVETECVECEAKWKVVGSRLIKKGMYPRCMCKTLLKRKGVIKEGPNMNKYLSMSW